MEYLIEIIETEELPTLAIRNNTPGTHLPLAIKESFAVITKYMQELGITEFSHPYVGYHNTDMQNLDVEIGYITTQAFPGNEEISSLSIAEGRKISFIHKGPYREMGHGYTYATKWMKEHGYSADSTVYELYLNSPEIVPESELLTKVLFPLSS